MIPGEMITASGDIDLNVGAARVLDQPTLTKEMLAEHIVALTRAQCLTMAQAALAVASPKATAEICDVIESLVNLPEIKAAKL